MAVSEKIKHLVFKWRARTLTPSERAELNAWYNEKISSEIDLSTEMSEPAYSEELLSRIHDRIGVDRKQASFIVPNWLRVAAMLLLVTTVSIFSYRYFQTTKQKSALQLVLTKSSTIRQVMLPDSSIVWLKGNSSLSFPKAFDRQERLVELHGEALFEVSHHTQWPFKIKSGNFTTTVLGTSFNINTGKTDNDFHINVLTGRVQVIQAKADNKADVYYVDANQSFEAEAGKVETVPVKEKQALRTMLTRGTNYDMNFDRAPFEVIMNQFSQKFDLEFEGYTGEYKACMVTANLTGLPMEKALQILCFSINATYKINGNKIKLTGGGCF